MALNNAILVVFFAIDYTSSPRQTIYPKIFEFLDSIIQMVLLVVSSSIIFYIGLIMVPAYLFVSTIELTLCIKYRIKISICQAIEYFVSYSYFAEIQPKHSVSKRSMA